MEARAKQVAKWTLAGTVAYWLANHAVRYLRRYDFRGRTALVTGGSRGLGLLLARRLAAAGARVAICGTHADELERARAELARGGRDVLGLTCDVTDRSAVERLVAAVREAWGPVDVLINNAGVIQVGPHEEMTLNDYQEAMNVHYWGPLYSTLAVLPDMQRLRSGRIINIASIGGILSVPHLLPYCASKFALVGLSEGFRAALPSDGIYVTTVCPGLMRTGSTLHAQFKGQNEAEYAWFSVSASAPFLSMSAERAADQILRACRESRAHAVLSLPAKAASLVHGIAPGISGDTLSWADRLLPSSGGIGTERASGLESRPRWLPSFLTRGSDRAAARNNQLGGGTRTSASKSSCNPHEKTSRRIAPIRWW
jgi:NAD(P)-dependent dehydrogenase (short-subunit alcohol dehydrogenase family)